jgi:queuine tRNA-ribosyltransferase
MTKPVHFNILARDSQSPARLGQLDLPHGSVQTPIFMPVGTYGTVKAMTPRDLNEAKAQIILGNTFHLWLRPGLDVIKKHSGLHRFMAWDKPILTDSGGFQVFSLGALRKISEEGVTFASPINGDKLFMSPEVSMEIQAVLNSDIAMQFDECTPYEIKGQPTSEKTARASLEMSLRWGDRSLKRFRELNTGNGLFGIVQGGIFENGEHYLSRASAFLLTRVAAAGPAPASLASLCPAPPALHCAAAAGGRARCGAGPLCRAIARCARGWRAGTMGGRSRLGRWP